MDIDQRFDRLEDMMTQLIKMVEENNKSVCNMEDNMKLMQSDITSMKSDISEIRGDLHQVKTTVRRLEEKNIKLVSMVERIAVRQLHTEAELDLIKAKLRD